jgi:hypothetical protein
MESLETQFDPSSQDCQLSLNETRFFGEFQSGGGGSRPFLPGTQRPHKETILLIEVCIVSFSLSLVRVIFKSNLM